MRVELTCARRGLKSMLRYRAQELRQCRRGQQQATQRYQSSFELYLGKHRVYGLSGILGL